MKALAVRLLVIGAIFSGVSVATHTAAADWPQWRGPNRDGIAPAGPKLLDAWPTNGAGPKLLWKSARIGSGSDGGAGSVTVADGRAFVFVHAKHSPGRQVAVTAKDLEELGWRDDLPGDLAKQIESARMAEKVHYLNSRKQDKVRFMSGEDLDAHIKKFIAGLEPAVSEKYGPYIEMRLRQGPTTGVEWALLAKVAALKDKECASFEELNGSLDGQLTAWHGGSLMYSRSRFLAKFNRYSDTVICLDAATGKELWRQEFPGSLPQETDFGASGTPAVWDGKCYAAGSAGMYCLSVKDGSVVWQAKTKFSNSSPLVMDGAVYVAVPEATAYDAKTGHVFWCQPALQSKSSSFTTWTHRGQHDLILATEGGENANPPGGVFCLDPINGAQRWSASCPAYSTPVIVGADTLVVIGCNAGTMAFQITPEKAEMLWSAPNNGDVHGTSPIVWQDGVYKTAGSYSGAPLQCFDLKTGAEKWSPKNGNFGQIWTSSPVLADGKIIINANETTVIMFKAAPEKYEELGRFNPGTANCSSPSIVAGRLFLRLKDAVACYDLTTK
jgi:outer membrane protein assembly factor BamB